MGARARTQGRSPQEPSPRRLMIVSTATVVSVVAVILVVEEFSRQPVLVTSLASSAFLLYYQPLNEINRFVPLVVGHLLAAATGFAASEILPTPYWAPAISITGTVVLLALLRLVHPPAVSTSLVFSYRPRDVSAVLTFGLTVAIVVALALIYALLRFGVQPSRWAHLFGFDDEQRD